jgi:hypothetical protein
MRFFEQIGDVGERRVFGRREDGTCHDVRDLVRMRFHVFRRQHLFPGQIFQPPGAPAPVGARFDPPDEVALAHDSEKLALLVDDRDGADAVREQDLGHLLDPRVRANADDGGNHHIGSFHVTCSSFSLLLLIYRPTGQRRLL